MPRGDAALDAVRDVLGWIGRLADQTLRVWITFTYPREAKRRGREMLVAASGSDERLYFKQMSPGDRLACDWLLRKGYVSQHPLIENLSNPGAFVTPKGRRYAHKLAGKAGP